MKETFTKFESQTNCTIHDLTKALECTQQNIDIVLSSQDIASKAAIAYLMCQAIERRREDLQGQLRRLDGLELEINRKVFKKEILHEHI